MIGKKVVFSDESKINVECSDGIRYCWKRDNEKLNDRLITRQSKYGKGHIMVCGCFGINCPGFACSTNDRINSELYIQIMEDEMKNSVPYCVDDQTDWYFLQDNASCHKSVETTSWFEKKKLM